jgi:NAD+ synthase (glutamine-hydrolysing)
MLDYVRIACAVPAVKVGDVQKNARDICDYMARADAGKVDILLFPELALTGYTCGDLFFQDALHKAVKEELHKILECSRQYPALTAVVGLPVRMGAKLYNCAAVIENGNLCGIVPKTHIPGNERRWFSSGTKAEQDFSDEWEAPIMAKQTFVKGGAVFGVEICEDLMAPHSASVAMATGGAEVILNLAASHELAGKRKYRQDLVKHQSGALNCVYAFCSAGGTESTSDLVFGGHCLIAENGRMLKETAPGIVSDDMIVQDCDLGRVRSDRLRRQYYHCGGELRNYLNQQALRGDGSLYPLRKLAFVPSDKVSREERCLEIFNIQVAGLKQRLATIGANAVIGISGGLDSTLALLVAVEAMRQLGRPLTDVYGVTMPCFGTSDRTYNNSWELMTKLGISSKEISIKDAVNLHFKDIGHDSSVHNATYENAQARERTQILMDYASVVGGIVVGTGDLSELALGWCTYNGDHMSMYGVNGSVPKTLIRWIIETVAELPDFVVAKDVLMDILDTPISPELLPPDAQGKIAQKTEDLVGPYALHDFYLFYALRYGFGPDKIYAMACRAFEGDFDSETIKKWLKNFYRRFFTQQFKRNCQPDGVKVGSVGIGPRGDWQMPSDASARLWLDAAEAL